MDYLTYFERLEYLLNMIENGRLSSPMQISARFNCCDKTARNMINKLREKGYNIRYSKTSRKYVLE
jgi:Mn-dependent DtxR family transcriptional regulator